MLFRSALTLSVEADGFTESALTALQVSLGELSPSARRQVGAVVEYHHPGQDWLLSDSLARLGASRVRAGIAWKSEDYETLDALFRDPDLAVRNEGVPDDPLPIESLELLRGVLPRPKRWSCKKCGESVHIDTHTCLCGKNRPDDKLAKLLAASNWGEGR